MQIIEDALTFDDVLLLPGHSNVLPKEVQLETKLTKEIQLNIPLLSAAMDTVTEAKLAIALAQEGGLGIIHKNMSIDSQATEVRRVKKYESGIVNDPITISPQTSVRELLDLVALHNISGVPVVSQQKLVGIVTRRDWRFESNLEQPVMEIMTAKDRLVTVEEGASKEEVIQLLHRHRLEKVLVVNSQFELRGLITVKDIQKAIDKPLACKDHLGQLRVGAAVGTGQDTEERISALVDAGVDVIVVDTAHGHSQKVLDQVKWVKTHFSQTQVIAGNIATPEAALALKEAGADAVKVGIGPGSICTTRVVTGVGMPQVTAVANIARALKNSYTSVIADGGIRYSGDIAKAIGAGADCVMVGGLLAGTEEAPGEVVLYQGRSYKSYRGMGSLGAMSARLGSSDRYFQDNVASAEKLVPEGVEGRVPYKGTMVQVVHQLMGGLRSSLGYVGVKNIEEMHDQAKFVRISNAGVSESHVHNVAITKEPPNYQTEF